MALPRESSEGYPRQFKREPDRLTALRDKLNLMVAVTEDVVINANSAEILNIETVSLQSFERNVRDSVLKGKLRPTC